MSLEIAELNLGASNAPARALYERRGHAVTEERIVAGGIRWVRLDRPAAR